MLELRSSGLNKAWLPLKYFSLVGRQYPRQVYSLWFNSQHCSRLNVSGVRHLPYFLERLNFRLFDFEVCERLCSRLLFQVETLIGMILDQNRLGLSQSRQYIEVWLEEVSKSVNVVHFIQAALSSSSANSHQQRVETLCKLQVLPEDGVSEEVCVFAYLPEYLHSSLLVFDLLATLLEQRTHGVIPLIDGLNQGQSEHPHMDHLHAQFVKL